MRETRKISIKTVQNLILIMCALCLSAACGAKKMSGTYTGTATAKLKPANSSSDTVSDVTSDTSPAAAALVTQDGDNVTIRFSNTELLKNCELKAKVTKNRGVIASGASCETQISGSSRDVNILNGEVNIGDFIDHEFMLQVYGSTGSSSDAETFNFRFEGMSAK